MNRSIRLSGLFGLVLACAACGGHGMFSIGGADSNPAELRSALVGEAPPQPSAPVVVLAMRRAQPSIVAYDLQAKRELWAVPGTASTRFAIAGDVVTYGAEGQIVARSLTDGRTLWSIDDWGEVLGVATDGRQVYYTALAGSVYRLGAHDARSGSLTWSHQTSSRLGAPAAWGQNVIVPLLDQWLLVLSGQTGQRVARARGVDDRISFVRTDASGVTFGSTQGVYRLDERAAVASRDQSAFARAQIPEALDGARYGHDGYDSAQSSFSAFDRNDKLLWRMPDAQGFAGGVVVYHAFRFLFGLDPEDGSLRWAYSHPRVDLVASQHTGTVVGLVAANGQVAAIDPQTGTLRYMASIEGQAMGATFAAEGWAPTETVAEIETPNTTAALTAIARDKDARFARIKKFALAALAARGGDDVVANLIGVLTSPETRPEVYESAARALVERRDVDALPALLAALDKRASYVTGEEAAAVGVLSRAIAALDRTKVSDADRKKATPILMAHLQSPATQGGDLDEVVAALGVVGDGSERPALRQWFLMHRADPSTLGETRALEVLALLLAQGAPQDRAVVRVTALDPATHPELAKKAVEALEKTRARP